MPNDTRTLIFHAISCAAGAVGAYASVLQLPNNKQFHYCLYAVMALLLLSALFDFLSWNARRPKRYEIGSQAIIDYMNDWLKKGGRAAIFSRDMSWASGVGVKQALLQKSRGDGLILFVEQETQLIRELKSAGAQVATYGDLDFVPMSRFTIVGYKTVGARIAIGSHENGKHLIQEYDMRDQAVFALANDLVSLMEKASKK